MSARPPHHPRARRRGARRWASTSHTRNVRVYKGKDDRWVVAMGRRVLSSHRTQELAATLGRRMARGHETELVIHGRNGRFRSKDSYGNESPRHDTEH